MAAAYKGLCCTSRWGKPLTLWAGVSTRGRSWHSGHRDAGGPLLDHMLRDRLPASVTRLAHSSRLIPLHKAVAGTVRPIAIPTVFRKTLSTICYQGEEPGESFGCDSIPCLRSTCMCMFLCLSASRVLSLSLRKRTTTALPRFVILGVGAALRLRLRASACLSPLWVLLLFGHLVQVFC